MASLNEARTCQESSGTIARKDSVTGVQAGTISGEAMDEMLRLAAAAESAGPPPLPEEELDLSKLPEGIVRFPEFDVAPPPASEPVKKPSRVLQLFGHRQPGSSPPPRIEEVKWPEDKTEHLRWRKLREAISKARRHLEIAEGQAEQDRKRLGGVGCVVLAELKRAREAVSKLEEEARQPGVPLPRRR